MKTTTIISNGAKSFGQEPDTIETLLEVLAAHPLDRRFERYGNFLYTLGSEKHGLIDPRLREEARREKRVRIFGNFFDVSHVFSIDTNDPAVIKTLAEAIRLNRNRADYKAQPAPAS